MPELKVGDTYMLKHGTRIYRVGGFADDGRKLLAYVHTPSEIHMAGSRIDYWLRDIDVDWDRHVVMPDLTTLPIGTRFSMMGIECDAWIIGANEQGGIVTAETNLPGSYKFLTLVRTGGHRKYAGIYVNPATIVLPTPPPTPIPVDETTGLWAITQ